MAKKKEHRAPSTSPPQPPSLGRATNILEERRNGTVTAAKKAATRRGRPADLFPLLVALRREMMICRTLRCGAPSSGLRVRDKAWWSSRKADNDARLAALKAKVDDVLESLGNVSGGTQLGAELDQLMDDLRGRWLPWLLGTKPSDNSFVPIDELFRRVGRVLASLRELVAATPSQTHIAVLPPAEEAYRWAGRCMMHLRFVTSIAQGVAKSTWDPVKLQLERMNARGKRELSAEEKLIYVQQSLHEIVGWITPHLCSLATEYRDAKPIMLRTEQEAQLLLPIGTRARREGNAVAMTALGLLGRVTMDALQVVRIHRIVQVASLDQAHALDLEEAVYDECVERWPTEGSRWSSFEVDLDRLDAELEHERLWVVRSVSLDGEDRLNGKVLALWRALRGQYKRTAELARELDTTEGNLRKLVHEAKRKGCVITNAWGEGYYRPDAPPPGRR